MKVANVDPDRAARAARALRDGAVQIEPADRPDTYVVRSFTADRQYTVHLNGELLCDCPDAIYNDEICKHLLAVVLAAGLNRRTV